MDDGDDDDDEEEEEEEEEDEGDMFIDPCIQCVYFNSNRKRAVTSSRSSSRLASPILIFFYLFFFLSFGSALRLDTHTAFPLYHNPQGPARVRRVGGC